jgi:hypothetical protein
MGSVMGLNIQAFHKNYGCLFSGNWQEKPQPHAQSTDTHQKQGGKTAHAPLEKQAALPAPASRFKKQITDWRHIISLHSQV